MIPDPTRQSEFELNLMQVGERTADRDRGFDVSDNASYMSGPAQVPNNFGRTGSIAQDSAHEAQQFFRQEITP